jgi:hypothetical protein
MKLFPFQFTLNMHVLCAKGNISPLPKHHAMQVKLGKVSVSALDMTGEPHIPAASLK